MSKRWIVLAALLTASLAYAQITNNTNPFTNQQGATVTAYRVQNVTPNDNCNEQFAQPNRAIWVGAEGNLRVATWGGDVVTITGISTGTLLPLVVQCVYATGTTASSIQLWW